MKTKRKQKRYTEEQEILDSIDRNKAIAQECLVNAVECDRIVEACRKQVAVLEASLDTLNDKQRAEAVADISALKYQERFKADEAKRLSARRIRIEQLKLPALKRTLAAFKTNLLSITDDPGVVLQ